MATSTSTDLQASQNAASTEFSPWLDQQQKPLIQFKNVTKKYGDFTAIDDLTLDIYAKEFFALLGPSGCGKTTLMRLLAGFETITSGEILVDGKSIAGIPPNKRPVNMMFQSYALFPHMNVAQNVGFGLKQEGKSKSEVSDRVNEMLKLVQLDDFANRKPDQLSGGQRQRVALARSLAKKPKLLLLDEPLGALDKKLREKTQFELVNLQEKLGMTFLIVTHDQEEAMTVASRIAVIDKGKLIQVDTPGQIYETPKSRYVADFIGDVNFIESQVTMLQADDRMVVNTSNDVTLNATQPDHGSVSEGDTVWVALRPEKIDIAKTEPTERNNRLKGKVIEISYVGNTSTYHVKLATGRMVKAQRTNRNRIRNRTIAWEDEVWLSWNDDAGTTLTE